MTTSDPQEVSRPVTQAVAATLTRAAIFLVVTIKPDDESRDTVRGFCGDLAGLIRAVEFRDIEAGLSCVMGFGSEAWDRLFGEPRPAELHPFREIRSGDRHAVATPGDLLFHIRAKRMDLCFELAAQIMAALADAVAPVDEVHGFRYFDDRDLVGFVDGTENPRGAAVLDAVFIGDEDAPFAGGSYVITQKYLHDIKGWNALSTEAQERIIGRRKLTDIELSDAEKPTSAHSALTVIEENGKEIKILRDNMPFGNVTRGEFGTYFIGYSRSPRTTEQMLENMFVGRPPGNYDRLLDFSTAVSGNLFFVPSMTFLDGVADAAPAVAPVLTPTSTPPAVTPAEAASPSAASVRDSSLGIGSLKGDTRHDNLHRELAPISDAAWAQIEEETARTLKRYLAGRRVVDVPGAGGSMLSAVGTGHLRSITPPASGILARQREVKALVELRVPFELTREAIDDVERGRERFRLAARQGRRQNDAFAEDGAIFEGYVDANIEGIRQGTSNPVMTLPSDVRDYPDAIAQALSQLRLAGVNGPYAVLFGEEAYTLLAETRDHGYPVLDHVKRLVRDEIIWAPAIAGAFVLTTRGGDFELDIGQDVSIGYSSHSDTAVRLYLQESFTFRLLTSEAAVALAPPAKASAG